MDDIQMQEAQQPSESPEDDGEVEDATTQEAPPSEEVPMSSDPRIAELEAQVSQMSGSLEEREASVQKLTLALEERENTVSHLQEQLALATSKYRSALLSSAPEVPEELVQGQAIEEIEASMAQARQMVERIRNQLEAQVASERVPTGAPTRSAPDLSALSPQEKIAYALGRAQR